ncbi:urocortin 3, like [Diretmus argenteus]
MLSSLKTLLLLSVLCAPTSSLCLRLYQSRSDLLCNNHIPAGVRSEEEEEEGYPGYPILDRWGSVLRLRSAEYDSSSSSSSSAESSREKRTSSAAANYRFLSRTKLRGKMLRNSSKGQGDRRSALTLSLDVPTNIMNVLFDVAKAKNLRAKAADNARLLAHIGRRK